MSKIHPTRRSATTLFAPEGLSAAMDCFPRSPTLPAQSPLYWVAHKDRYLRQLLIRDIESLTRRRLLVYFTDMDNSAGLIDPADDGPLLELLGDANTEPTDLMLETPGGLTDATEKICSILRSRAPDLRVIVPRKAKSNGTLIALCGASILMSDSSELGPIDPMVLGGVPAEFILNSKSGNPIHEQFAECAIRQTRTLATMLLSTGMLRGQKPEDVERIVSKLASRNHYASHGGVIDAQEAKSLGLVIEHVPQEAPLWKAIWLLRAMYAHDCGRDRRTKMFESAAVSTSVAAKE